MEGDGDELCRSIMVSPGETYAVPPGVPHASRRAGERPVRFPIGWQPRTIASYVDQVDGVALA